MTKGLPLKVILPPDSITHSILRVNNNNELRQIDSNSVIQLWR